MLTKARVEGRIRGAFGDTWSDCPYHLHTSAREEWFKGLREGHSAACALERRLMEEEDLG